jgi:hypothetical protein
MKIKSFICITYLSKVNLIGRKCGKVIGWSLKFVRYKNNQQDFVTLNVNFHFEIKEDYLLRQVANQKKDQKESILIK